MPLLQRVTDKPEQDVRGPVPEGPSPAAPSGSLCRRGVAEAGMTPVSGPGLAHHSSP